MVHNFSLKDKTVVLTGGYGFLGKAVTESLLFHEATVYILARDLNKFDKAFKGNKYLNKNLFFQKCDISKTSSIKKAFEDVSNKHTIDVLINNAFYSKGQSPLNLSDEDWNTGIDGTLNSVFKSTREIIPFFQQNGKGKIINVSSMYGMVAPEFDVYDDHEQFLNPPHYGAAKAAVIQLTKYYASYLGKMGITVNAVTPGPFPSIAVQEEEGFVEKLKSKTCLNRIGKPEDLAGAFVFLSSEASNFMTGQNLIIDGGWTIK